MNRFDFDINVYTDRIIEASPKSADKRKEITEILSRLCKDVALITYENNFLINENKDKVKRI